MAGYRGYSMSNNAYDAYTNGEMPASKWTKEAMLEAIYAIYPQCPKLIEKLRKQELFDYFFYPSSWHHTSKMYNRTDFYAVSEIAVERITEDYLKDIINQRGNATAQPVTEKQFVIVSYKENQGTSRHIRMETIFNAGYVIGKYFYSFDGYTKKKADGKYFRIEEKDISEEKALAFWNSEQGKIQQLEHWLSTAKTAKKGLKDYDVLLLTTDLVPKGSMYTKYIGKKLYFPKRK